MDEIKIAANIEAITEVVIFFLIFSLNIKKDTKAKTGNIIKYILYHKPNKPNKTKII